MTKGKLRDRKEPLKLKEDREERSVFPWEPALGST